MSPPLGNIVIAGGGTAGWMTAAALARLHASGKTKIILVESDEIGTIGVGEATIPPIKAFNAMLGIDEAEFVAATQGTFKLGIEFVGWGKIGQRYLHPFGPIGQDINGVRFHQIWRHLHSHGLVGPLSDFSLSWQAAKRNGFAVPPNDHRSPLSALDYAYHFDAGLYAAFLRAYSEKRGVRRVEGKITSVEKESETGNLIALTLEDDQKIDGDFFIDCTGFRGLLIEQALETGYDDWSHYLPCDRALAVPCERVEPLIPYTRATARAAGWQWRIGLQHRTGNGLVYCSGAISDDAAHATLLSNLDGVPLGEPRPIQFKTGRRKLAWNKNCVAIGLSAGFLEPLESTSIHLIQAGISKLLSLLPDCDIDPRLRNEYNRQSQIQWLQVRDFIIAHYKLNQRTHDPFWRQCAAMEIPDRLQNKLDLFGHSGRIFREEDDLFADPSWIAVLLGQNHAPKQDDPLTATLPQDTIVRMLTQISQTFATTAQAMPSHADFIASYCQAQLQGNRT
jgi:tryptophan 7-halogenase